MNDDTMNDSAEATIQKSASPESAKTRRDRGQTHVTRHGLLSRDIVRALIRSGESARNVRRYERQFRVYFRIQGTLGEHFFDQWWSFHLRLVLSAKLEANTLTPERSNRRALIPLELREGTLPTLVSSPNQNASEYPHNIYEFPQDLFQQLALAQRYGAYHAREANRLMAPLLVMRNGGEAALEKWLLDGLEITKIQKLGR